MSQMSAKPDFAHKNSNLDTYVTSSRPRQEPFATSQEIRDRGSIFIANLYPASSPSEARSRIDHVKHVLHAAKAATHEIAAWRCMVLKPGCNGLGGPNDFEVQVGSIDDGEKWAGEKVLRVMQSYAVIDAVVIVSRWYGGTMIGPARFSHIETCTTEVCQQFKRTEELQDCISTLTSLDDVLAGLRDQYRMETSSGDSPADSKGESMPKDYSKLDIDKAKRLIVARENSIKSVRTLLIQRQKEAQSTSTTVGHS